VLSLLALALPDRDFRLCVSALMRGLAWRVTFSAFKRPTSRNDTPMPLSGAQSLVALHNLHCRADAHANPINSGLICFRAAAASNGNPGLCLAVRPAGQQAASGPQATINVNPAP
jgi:hypothetical protein